MTTIKAPPVKRGLGPATAASLLAPAAVVVASAVGLASGAGRYAQSQSVLVSQGADVANLIAVLLVLLAMWLARRGSSTALLLWPGGPFYLAYAYVPYLVGAPFTPLVFDVVVAFLAAAYALASLATGIAEQGLAPSQGPAGSPTRVPVDSRGRRLVGDDGVRRLLDSVSVHV